MNSLALLREMSLASGVSGYEDQVREIVRNALEPLVDSLRFDALGNVIAMRKGQRGTDATSHAIMLAAHTDEIGLIVTGFDESFIRFARVGGVDLRTILGQEVTVHGRRPLSGIVASLPPHVLSEADRKKAVPLDKLFIDIGMSEEKLREWVQVGDLITMRRDFVELAESYASGKALDDRAGVAAMILCMEELHSLRHEWDVYAVATSQEEIGLRGAMVSAYGIAPDAAIAIDVGFGSQQGVGEEESMAMDGGPAIAIGPNVHPLIRQRLCTVAKELEIKSQTEVVAGASGTDAWAIQVAREGIPTGLLSIPLRYMHTSVETVCLRDIERTARLMTSFIAGLDQSFAVELGL